VVLLAVFSSPVSAPLPRTRERVRLRDLVTIISTESILATDGGLRPRVLGDEGGDVTLPAGDDAALLGLAFERRLWREAGVEVGAGGALPLLPTSLSCSKAGTWTRTRDRGRPRPRAGVDAGVAVGTVSAALGFGARALLLLSLLLLSLPLAFGLSASTPRAISAIPVSSVPLETPSSSSPSPSSAGGRARLARPLVLAPAPARSFGFANRARMLWQFSSRQEISMSSAFVESARKRARFASVCCAAQK